MSPTMPMGTILTTSSPSSSITVPPEVHRPLHVLLISTYELGHQPLHQATAASALIAAGHETRCMDLAIGPWKKTDVEWAEIVGISVPMHTAMRLAEKVATRVRSTQPTLPIATF